jgi:hypothetical protein
MAKGRNTRSIGIRLPNELVDAIDAEAKALAMTRNELLGRRLATAFARVLEGRKTAYISQNPDTDRWELPE